MNVRGRNSVLEQRLSFFIENRHWNELISYLGMLSNADFRTSGTIMGERLLRGVEADLFYDVFQQLVNYNAKAFLVTLTKCLCVRLKNKTLTLNHPRLIAFATLVKDEERNIDRVKFISLVLPVLMETEDIRFLFQIFGIEEPSEKLLYLMKCPTMPAAYVLFTLLKCMENDVTALEKCCHILKRRGDRLSFNLVSIIISYFGLTGVSGTFSLRLLPYELNYLDASYDTFCKVMMRI